VHKIKSELAVWKLTALWVFSEAMFGGFLHALRIPFTGLFIGGVAVVFISLIAFFSSNRTSIFKATLFVVLIKFMISPYTPLTAYLAVFIEGMLGQILFLNKKFFKLSAIVLGISFLLYSAFQKIIILTIVFGNTLWKSIDDFSFFILNQFFITANKLPSFSSLLILLYVGLHAIGGFVFGVIAGKSPKWIEHHLEKNKLSLDNNFEIINKNIGNAKKRKRLWWKRPTGIIVFLFFILLIVLSYLNPQWGSTRSTEIIIMLFRLIIVIIIWYYFISPIVTRYLHNRFKEKQNKYSNELNELISLFPHINSIIIHSWKSSADFKGFKRLKYFVTDVLVLVIMVEFRA
jgi:hypothetical protein